MSFTSVGAGAGPSSPPSRTHGIPAVTILPRKRSALPQLGREEAPCRGARHDESFGRPSDICLRDRVGHGDRAGGSEGANLIEASREGLGGVLPSSFRTSF